MTCVIFPLPSSKGWCWCKTESMTCLEWKIIFIFFTLQRSVQLHQARIPDLLDCWSYRFIFFKSTKMRLSFWKVTPQVQYCHFLFQLWFHHSKHWWLFATSSECCKVIVVAWLFPNFLGLRVGLNYQQTVISNSLPSQSQPLEQQT